MSVRDPFSILSLFVGGPAELALSKGAPIFTDDRMGLEFSAPREIHRRSSGENGEVIGGALARETKAVREAKAAAT